MAGLELAAVLEVMQAQPLMAQAAEEERTGGSEETGEERRVQVISPVLGPLLLLVAIMIT